MALAVGLAVNPTIPKMLDLFGTASQTGWSTVYVKLHTGIPGADGTNGASSETTRKAVTFDPASTSNGTKVASGTLPSWTSWGQGTETIQYLSMWTSVGPTGGTFLGSLELSSPRTVNFSDTINITALTLAISTKATT